jgi:hypothetical protein
MKGQHNICATKIVTLTARIWVDLPVLVKRLTASKYSYHSRNESADDKAETHVYPDAIRPAKSRLVNVR